MTSPDERAQAMAILEPIEQILTLASIAVFYKTNRFNHALATHNGLLYHVEPPSSILFRPRNLETNYLETPP